MSDQMTTTASDVPSTKEKKPELTFQKLQKQGKADYESAGERLYKALDSAYQIYLLGKERPDEFRNFAAKNDITIGKNADKSPFIVPLRLIIGSDKRHSPDRARYNLALTRVQVLNAAKPLLEVGEVAHYIQTYEGKVDALVEEARGIKKNETNDKKLKEAKDKKGGEILLARPPVGQIKGFAEPGSEGFRLILCHLDAIGNLAVYNEATNSGVESILRSVFNREEENKPKPIYLAHWLDLVVKGFGVAMGGAALFLLNHQGYCYAYAEGKVGVRIKIPAIPEIKEGEVLVLPISEIDPLKKYLKAYPSFDETSITSTSEKLICKLPSSPLEIPYRTNIGIGADKILNEPQFIGLYTVEKGGGEFLKTWESSVGKRIRKIYFIKELKPKNPEGEIGRKIVEKEKSFLDYDIIFHNEGIDVGGEEQGKGFITVKPIEPLSVEKLEGVLKVGLLPQTIIALEKLGTASLELGVIDQSQICLVAKGTDFEIRADVRLTVLPQIPVLPESQNAG